MPLALLLSFASAVAYILVWSFMKGFSGCGPPGHSTSGRIFSGAPFVFPALSVFALIFVGARLHWRVRTVVAAVVTTVGVAAVLEILVFLVEFSAHHCGE